MRQLLVYILLSCGLHSFASDTLKVNVITVPASCEKGSATLEISGGTAPYTILWNSGNTGNLFEPSVAGTFTVQVTDAADRDTTVSYNIDIVDCGVTISNHFTPNGDGYNDTWGIGHASYYPNFELVVYNRWGQQVYRQEGTYIPWDGTQFGLKLPDGTYYYVFYYDRSDRGRLVKGDVSILR